MHNMPVEPTTDTLSLYTVYMCHHIKPDLVDTYLLGICHQLKPYFPHVWEIQKSCLVHCTLEGCKWLQGTLTVRKWALTIADLDLVCTTHSHNPTHDNLLFCTQLCVGFFTLMCLTWPDDSNLCDPCKVTKYNSIVINDSSFQFFLPGHKANKFFTENTIILCCNPFPCDLMLLFHLYIHSCNCLFPLSSPLWLKSNGDIPTRSFFMRQLQGFFDKDVGGQSMRAGGATSLAENGVAPHCFKPLHMLTSLQPVQWMRTC